MALLRPPIHSLAGVPARREDGRRFLVFWNKANSKLTNTRL